jgi:Ser/Thr protein kinase RdoA (MazF antagonist)
MSNKKYAFRYYEKRLLDYVLFEIDLLQYLAAQSYPCPAPLKNKESGYVGEYNSKPYAIFEFLEGEHNDDEANAKEVARAIGVLHALTIDHRPGYSEARDTYNPTSSWNSAVGNATRVIDSAERDERLKWLRTELDGLELPDTMPKGVVHGDTNPSNFLYKDGHISAVLDFDQASYTYLLYDVANLLFWWAWPNMGNLNLEVAKQLLAEYEKYRQLTDDEKLHLFDMLKMSNFMGMGWFIHEDDDFSNGKRKTEFLNNIGRDGLRRALL